MVIHAVLYDAANSGSFYNREITAINNLNRPLMQDAFGDAKSKLIPRFFRFCHVFSSNVIPACLAALFYSGRVIR